MCAPRYLAGLMTTQGSLTSRQLCQMPLNGGEAYPVRTWLSSWNRSIHIYVHLDPVLGLDCCCCGASALATLGTHAVESLQSLQTPEVCPAMRRERMVQTMFQRYGFAGVQVQIQAVLTLYSQGRLSTRHKTHSQASYSITPVPQHHLLQSLPHSLVDAIRALGCDFIVLLPYGLRRTDLMHCSLYPG